MTDKEILLQLLAKAGITVTDYDTFISLDLDAMDDDDCCDGHMLPDLDFNFDFKGNLTGAELD